MSTRRYQVLDLGVPHTVFGINNRRQAVGHQVVLPDGRTRAMVLENGTVRELGSLGGSFSTARGVNDEGLIVGGSLVADDESHHGFLFDGVRMHDLNSLLIDARWEVLHAFAVNDCAEIVAIATREGKDRAVLLVPITAA